jgi:predicted nucleotidyltransferase component of viral defense system
MTKVPRDIGASVRARLLRLAQKRGEDFQLVLTRYANERLLYRLASSAHAPHFVLKGAALFVVWTGAPHRATRDVDLLGFGDPTTARVHAVFTDLLRLAVDDDGVLFDHDSLEVGPIRAEQQYGGQRVTLTATVSSARVRLQFDVGFGDAVTPAPTLVEFPALLEFPAPLLRAYPRETVVAEKLEAMVQLGLANSRMKDFYDLVILARSFEFEGRVLARAIRATFERRTTPLPRSLPVALTPAFAEDPSKQTQWTAFLRKAGVQGEAKLPVAVEAIVDFAGPALAAAAQSEAWAATWPPGGPWSDASRRLTA